MLRTQILFLALIAALVAQPSRGHGQESESLFVSEGLCHRCHGGSDSASEDLPTDFVLMDEAPKFLENDKHSKAFALLSTERGKQIASRLGISDVSKAHECLTCHANVRKGDSPPMSLMRNGVGCQSCHGGAKAWEFKHSDQRSRWRSISPETKEREFNFVDVRNPVRRAQQCFSCHIGSAEQGKVLTHRMYAAGHPPLPSFELASFAQQLPPHWRTIGEKGEFSDKAEYLAVNYSGMEHDPSQDLPRTKTVILAGIMALRESVALFASQTEAVAAQHGALQHPEFALFDCAACHHALRTPGWRQARGYRGSPPGRPMMPVWPSVLVKVSLRHLAPVLAPKLETDNDGAYAKLQDRFSQFHDRLLRAVAARPFGDLQRIKDAAGPFVSWLDELAEHTAHANCDQNAAKRAIQTLGELMTDDFPDYHSARQLVWAMSIIQTELATPYPKRADFIPAEAANVESLEKRKLRETQDRAIFEDWKSRWDNSWKETRMQLDQHGLLEILALELPSGSEAGPTRSDPQYQSKLEQALPRLLDLAADYDPVEFRGALASYLEAIEAAGQDAAE